MLYAHKNICSVPSPELILGGGAELWGRSPPAPQAALTSARYGRKMALARLPVMPLRMKMMEMRSQPASFSRSRSTVIWKVTDTRQWMMLEVEDQC